MIEVERVDYIRVPVTDIEEATHFYGEVLGLPESEYSDGEVETPNVTLGFWDPEADGEPFVPNEAGIGLRVADVHAAVDDVRAAGADVIGIEDSGVCQMGFVKDPDGNVLILHRRYAPRERRGQG